MSKKFIDLVRLDSTNEKYLKDITESEFFGFPLQPIIDAEEALLSPDKKSVAYFSMEYGLAPSIYHTFKTVNPISKNNILTEHEVFSNMKDMDYYHTLPVKKLLDLPIYSGGLGVLAGDSLKSVADHKLSLAAIGILWNKGYFRQKFWFKAGGQVPEAISWDPDSYPGLIPLKPKINITLSGQKLNIRLWKYFVYSNDLKHALPLILLDANLPENPEFFRDLTDQLYKSNNNWIKIAQRMILGIGGIKALDALGYSIDKYHLNEGHAALAITEKIKKEPLEYLSKIFAFTCHTPVEAGHDRFDMQELEAALGKENIETVKKLGRDEHNPHIANFTMLALNTCNKVNGVARKHGEVMRLQFPKYQDKIKSITNGVHTFTWISQPIRELLQKYQAQIGDWESDPTLLKNVANLSQDITFRKDLWDAHIKNKKGMADFLKYWFFNEKTFTIAWARRLALYKRPGMLLHNINRLLEIAEKIGPLQIIIAGKAHPADIPASMHMDEMLEKISALSGERRQIRICFLENYDTYFAKILTSSVDVWLNNPLPPFEASGTSGMKAIINGVLQFSTLDGWVVEAADKNIGKIFGYVPGPNEIGGEDNLRIEEDSLALYSGLEELVAQYYATLTDQQPLIKSVWIERMVNCIAQSGFFSTHRMITEYNANVWQI